MSVSSDLQSALRAAGSAVGGALSAVGRAVGGALASLASSTADKASSAYSAVKDAIAIAAKSYFNGIRFIFQKLKGQGRNQEEASLNLIEKILHSTISCAWIFALLASVIYHSSLSTVKLLKFGWSSGFIENNSTGYSFNRYSIIGLPGILLGACLGSISYIIKQNYENFLRFSSKTLEVLDNIYKDSDLNSKLNLNERRDKSRRYYILSLIVSVPALCLALGTGFFVTLYKFCIQNYYGFIESLKYTANYDFYIAGSNDVNGISKSNAKTIAKVLSFPGILAGILMGSTWQIFNNALKIGVFLASEITNYAYHKQTINLPSKQMHIIAKIIGLPLGLPLGIVSGIFGFFTVGLVRNNIYATKYIYYKLKSVINNIDDSILNHPKNIKNLTRLYGFGFLGAIIGLTGVITLIVIPKFIINNYKAFEYVFLKLMQLTSEDVSIGEVESPKFTILQKILSAPGAILSVVVTSPIAFITAIFINTYITVGQVYNNIEMALQDNNDNSLDNSKKTQNRSALQKLRLYSFGFLGLIIGFALALAIKIGPRFAMYNYKSARYIFSKIINMSYHEALISEEKNPEFRLIQKILSLPGAILSIVISSPISFILAIVRNTYKVTANLYDNANAVFSDDNINTQETHSLNAVQKLRLYSFGFMGFIFGSALVFFNIVIPKFITNNYRAFKYVFLKFIHATSENDFVGVVDKPQFNILQKILSTPGAVLGIVISSPISFILAIALNTYNTAAEIYNSIEIAFKDKNDNNNLDKTQTTIKRSALQKLRLYSFGFLGLIIGFALALAIKIGPRFAMYNYKSARYIFSKVINISYHEALISEEKNPEFRLIQKILSLPGAIVSIVISSPIAFILAIVFNTYKISSDIYKSIKNSFTADDIQKTQDELKNTNFTKLQKLRLYVFGSLGVFIGFTLAFSGIMLPRFIENNYILGKYVFCKLFNITAPEKMTYKNLPTPAKTWAQIANPFGFIVGGALGIGVAGFVFFARLIINSAQTFAEFSAGFLNLSLERKIFNNWRKNENKTNRFGFGLLGLVLSSPFAALGLGIMVLKYVPIICSMVVSAPIVAMWRAIRELIKFKKETHRFDKIINENEQNKNNFKRLLKYIYGSLGIFGSVPESLNAEIEKINLTNLEKNDNHKGYRPEWHLQTARFVRKAFTFNTRTIAEKFLAKVVESTDYTNINDILNTIDNTITSEENGCFFSAVDLIALQEALYQIKAVIITAYNKAYGATQNNTYEPPKYTTMQYLFFNENANANANADVLAVK